MLNKIEDILKYFLKSSDFKEFEDKKYPVSLNQRILGLHPIECESVFLITRVFILSISEQLNIKDLKLIKNISKINYINMLNDLINYKKILNNIILNDEMKEDKRYNNVFFLSLDITIFTIISTRENSTEGLFLIWKSLIRSRDQIDNSLSWIRKYETKHNTSLIPGIGNPKRYLQDQDLKVINRTLPDFLKPNKKN
jgi:hypothetical protein